MVRIFRQLFVLSLNLKDRECLFLHVWLSAMDVRLSSSFPVMVSQTPHRTLSSLDRSQYQNPWALFPWVLCLKLTAILWHTLLEKPPSIFCGTFHRTTLPKFILSPSQKRFASSWLRTLLHMLLQQTPIQILLLPELISFRRPFGNIHWAHPLSLTHSLQRGTSRSGFDREQSIHHLFHSVLSFSVQRWIIL